MRSTGSTSSSGPARAARRCACASRSWSRICAPTTSIDGAREIAIPLGIRAYWSYPILDRSGSAVGAIALLNTAAGQPEEMHLRVLEALSPLAHHVTEHYRRETALESADMRIASLAESIPGVVYQRIVRPDGDIRYTYISDGVQDLFGVSPEEIIADPQALFDCHAPEYSATFRERLLAASRDLTMWDVEAAIIARDGTRKWTPRPRPAASPRRRRGGVGRRHPRRHVDQGDPTCGSPPPAKPSPNSSPTSATSCARR